jgi:hypothetical protein
MPLLQKRTLGGWGFTPAKPETAQEKPARAPRKKVKHDPRLVAAARELRDRWLEQVNATPLLSHGKYDITRALSANTTPIAALPTPGSTGSPQAIAA